MAIKMVSEANMKTQNRDARLVFYTNKKLKAIVTEEAARQDVTVSTLLRKQLRKWITNDEWEK
jgi:hypothetical protein